MFKELKIIHSDEAIVVADKPGGMLSVPGRGADKQDCMVSRLKSHFPDMIDQPAVHRLDMYTSGLMVFAVTREAHRNLNRQFENREVKKRYVAVVEGIVDTAAGNICLPFRLDPENRPYQIYDPVQGKIGISNWQALGFDGTRTRILFTPLTGRTHQLRLHAAHHLGLNAPIVGDSLYGQGNDGDEMLLHATYLEFTHPVTGEVISFRSEPSF